LEEEEKKVNQHEDEYTPIDSTGTVMQDAFRRMLERKLLAQHKAKSQKPVIMLSDDTKIKDFLWRDIKYEACMVGFNVDNEQYGFTQEEQSLI